MNVCDFTFSKEMVDDLRRQSTTALLEARVRREMYVEALASFYRDRLRDAVGHFVSADLPFDCVIPFAEGDTVCRVVGVSVEWDDECGRVATLDYHEKLKSGKWSRMLRQVDAEWALQVLKRA